MNGKRSPSDSVPPGYKRTEVGVIPEDWEVMKIREFTDCVAGGTPSTQISAYWGGDTPWMSSGELHKKLVSQVDRRITDLGLRNSSAKLLPPNCVLVGLAGQGKTRGTVAVNTIPLSTNQSIAAILPSSKADSRYLFYNLENRYLELRELSSGEGGRGGLNLTIIRDIVISLPPLPEQRAIAQALADADAWIEALDRLIAKKRAIKQAAMGDLLTGRVRLPGFSGVGMKHTEIGEIPEDWDITTIGQLGKFGKGRGIKRNDVSEIGFPCIRYGEIYTLYDYFVTETVSKISESVAKQSQEIQKGDLLFTGSGETAEEIGKCVAYLGDEPAYAGGDVIILTPTADDALFLGYLFNSPIVVDQKAQFGQGDAVVHISIRNLENIKIPLPSLREQQAIARVLSDMDAEIEALERERDKARAIKQGMMQELLTGRIRLVERTPVTQSDQIVRKSKGRNEAFREAVLLSVITQRFGSKRYPIGRFRRTKLVYLLRRHIQAGVADYLKQAAGPYRPKTKYGYAEKIALRRQYVQTHQCEDRKGFIPGPRVHEAEHYFEKWYGREPLQWMEQFRYRKNEDLELLTTVDMAMGELQAAGKPVHVAGIKTLIAESEIWRAKLERPIFSDIKIAQAIREIRQFFPDR